ncbi:MAG TPA: hypothetical protein VIJ11_03325 [Galbitalea sp.]
MTAPNRTKGTNGTTLWRVVAGVVVVGLALLCWNQIARDLGGILYFPLQFSDLQQLPRPSGGTAVVSSYSVGDVTIGLTHLSSQLQWMLAIGTVIRFVLVTAVILTIGVVWVRTSEGRPFAPAITRALVALAVLIAVAGTGLEVLQNFINAREAFEAVGPGTDGNYYLGTGFTITGTSILIAIGIAVLASAFAIGARLTRDTEGLV